MGLIGSQNIYQDSEHRLGFHPATDDTRPLHQQVRRHMMWLDSWILSNIPEGREKSLARTALQEATMWCNAAIACNMAPIVTEPGVFDN